MCACGNRDLRVRVTPTAIVYSAHEYSVYGPDLFLAKAEDYIKTHAARDLGSPMFLYYAMQNVHDPLQVLARMCMRGRRWIYDTV